jgi:hypothetical protein
MQNCLVIHIKYFPPYQFSIYAINARFLMISNQSSPISVTYHNKINATSRKVAFSIPSDAIGCFPSRHSMVLRFIQPPTEISTRNKSQPMRKADNLTAISERIV